MSDKVVKKRIFLTLTKIYVDALDQLIEEGKYLSRNVAIRDALRLFQFHGIETFSDKGAKLEDDAPSERWFVIKLLISSLYPKKGKNHPLLSQIWIIFTIFAREGFFTTLSCQLSNEVMNQLEVSNVI